MLGDWHFGLLFKCQIGKKDLFRVRPPIKDRDIIIIIIIIIIAAAAAAMAAVVVVVASF